MYRGIQGMNRQFVDTLQIGTKTGASWGSAPVAEAWTWDTINTVRGFVQQKTSQEVMLGKGENTEGSEVTLTDATIYIPADTTITNKQRLKLTHRNRVALGTTETYSIIGTPQAAGACLVCNAKRETGESAR